MDIQTILNSVYDSTNGQINVSAAASAQTTTGTVEDIINNSYDSSGNTLKVVAS